MFIGPKYEMQEGEEKMHISCYFIDTKIFILTLLLIIFSEIPLILDERKKKFYMLVMKFY